jgi:TnpA family transposase
MIIRHRNTEHKRLRILGDDEIAALYERPRFTQPERIEYFSLLPREKSALEQFHSIKSKIFFILQLGYFKARQLFFIFGLREAEEDANYISAKYFPSFAISDTDLEITKVTRLKQQHSIIELCNYHNCGARERRQLDLKARQAARLCAKPIYVLRALINYLQEHRIIMPGYSFMQDTVGAALSYEQKRLVTITRDYLRPADIEVLQRLLADSPGLYEITKLKHEPRDFKASEIKREIQRGEQIRPLYLLAKEFLPDLAISNESIKYYASLVGYYSVQKLKQLNKWLTYLYLLCFIYHRYQRLNDNLINCLIYKVRQYSDEAKTAAKEKVYQFLSENKEDLQKAGQVLKLFTSDTIARQTPFQEVQAQAFTILTRDKLKFVAEHMTTDAKFDEIALQWEHIDKLAAQFKPYLRPILQNVEFVAISAHTPLLKAIRFLKMAFGKGKSLSSFRASAFPIEFVPNSIKRYLYGRDARRRKQLLTNRYEFLIYRLLRYGLEAVDIFCRDSVRFRSFEDDLLDNKQWQQKEKLLIDIGLPLLQQPIKEHLHELEQRLEAKNDKVNERIANGENSHFQINHYGPRPHWTLPYPRSDESTNHPFFDLIKQVDIGSMLNFVNQQCQWLNAFEHVLGRYAKQEADVRLLMACLLAWATNMGLGRMSEISDIAYHQLAATSDNFIRLETLRQANDIVSNALARLSIFLHYNIGGTLHSSSDGQKFETQLDTINARYSPKYFGLKKGIVSYTLVANHVPINAKIIGANEHESHFVFDILFNNTTDIEPELHSTDTHGTNEVNFALLHLFGYKFAPRYRDIHDKLTKDLYGFKHPSQYRGIIKPVRKIHTDLIVAEWENIQRIILSLALKTTTQSIIVGKLSAHTRKNKTQRALWEYDNIIKSLYLLDYIDSLPLRQNVQRALNRGENYHKLRRAVSHANFGKLRLKTEYDQQIWQECSRLITNCIVYYNATIISNLLTYKAQIGDSEAITLLKQVSPVAWQHINLHGRYEFNNQLEPIDIDAIVQLLALAHIPQNSEV